MKSVRLLLILPLLLCAAPRARAGQDATKSVQQSAAAAAAPLRNEDVSKMVGAGLAAEVVVAKIKSSAAAFDTSPEALRRLKEAGVPDAVLLAMVEASLRGVAAPPAPARPAEVLLPASTIVDVEAAYDINSQLVKTGDALSFRVVNPVKVNGVTVIEAGATATGRVEVAKRGGHWGKAGTLVWSLQYVTAVDGSRVPLQFATIRQKGDSKGAKVATQVALTGAVFWFAPPVALLHGFKRGGNAFIPAGKRFEAFVQGDSKIKTGGTR
ncbi:MAG TPA: hypothetical protein VGV38_15005 [Pyrinomonadaceae bacterium]|nr:hypothetical protein [Pyrinomonadaceae bacterium]